MRKAHGQFLGERRCSIKTRGSDWGAAWGEAGDGLEIWDENEPAMSNI